VELPATLRVAMQAGKRSGGGSGRKKPTGLEKRGLGSAFAKASADTDGQAAKPEALAGMSAVEAAELRNWLAAQAAAGAAPPVDPERLNHEFLAFMQQVAALLHLRPCEVEKLTRLTHQHQRKLKPDPVGQGETHVTLFTVVCWTNGLRLPLRPVLEWLLARLSSLLLLWEPLAA
jgi:hypothetical protein